MVRKKKGSALGFYVVTCHSLADPTVENFAVITRDYLRTHPEDRQLYQDTKARSPLTFLTSFPSVCAGRRKAESVNERIQDRKDQGDRGDRHACQAMARGKGE